MWRIDAKWFPQKGDKAAKPAKFALYAIVAKGATVAGKDCWVLTLAAVDELPDDTDFVLHASIDKNTGWPVKAVQLDGEYEAKFIAFGNKSAIAPPLEFFPAELFAIVEPGEFTSGVNKIVLTKEKSEGQTKAGLTFLENDTEQWRIRQTWKDGELFWHSYEKYLKGRLSFRATAKVFELAKRTDAEKTVEQKAADAAAKAAEEKAKKYRDAHPLRQDKRLYALVHVEPKRPSVAHVLRRLKEATNLDIDIDPELEKHVPDLGYISPGPEGYFAWQLMEHLTKIEIENARWEKTATGYRFTGVSKVPPGRQLVTSDDQPPPPERTGRSFRWLLVPGAALALIIIALGAVLIVRRRSSKAASQAKRK